MDLKNRRNFIKKTITGTAGAVLVPGSLINLRSTGFSSSGPARTNLLKDGGAWISFSPGEKRTTLFSRIKHTGSSNYPLLIIEGNNNPESIGCWKRKLPKLEKGKRYKITASFSIMDIDDFSENVRGIITKNQNEYAELSQLIHDNKTNWLTGEIVPQDDEDQLELCLYLMSTPDGTVKWKDVFLEDITKTWQPRYVELAAISGRPSGARTPADAIEFYCNQIDQIQSPNLDLICLGETINVDGVPRERITLAEAIPGPSTSKLAEKAKQLNTYIVAGILERENDKIYNTAVLIDRQGNLAGKYHKVHLTIKEQFVEGVMRGDDYPVFHTDFGKLGVLICYDNHFPEVMRILAVKGADVVAFPNMGDGRVSPGGVWEPYMRSRAIDNHLPVVTAVNTPGQSCIVNGGGEIRAIDQDEKAGTIVQARVDLDSSVENFSGRSIQKRYLLLRQPDTYSPLTKHNWDF